jgi:hypothetical protein
MTTNHPARLSQRFNESVRSLLESRLDRTLAARSEFFISSCVNMLEEDFAELDPSKEIDPRFIRSLLVRR